jgi:hypothetical protein
MNLFEVLGTAANIASAFDLFGVKRSTSIDGFYPFVCTSESHSDGMEVTTHAVQQGFVVTDHVMRKPSTLTLDCVFEGDYFGVNMSDKYADCLRIMHLGEVVDVVTSNRLYSNMIITSLDTTTDTDSERILAVRIEMVEIRIVNAEVVDVPAEEKQADPKKTGKTKNAGSKQTTSGSGSKGSKSGAAKAADATKTKRVSSLKSAANRAGL